MVTKKNLHSVELNPDAILNVTIAGNIIETRYSEHRNSAPVARNISKDECVNIKTGEIIQKKHSKSRESNISSVNKSLRKVRDLINTNITDSRSALFVTLTFKDNMSDYSGLSDTYKAFYRRFKNYCRKNGITEPKYIWVPEPQATGSWHIHLILFWQDAAPYISNHDIDTIWSNGITHTTKVDCISNLGLYLTSHMSDLPEDECTNSRRASKRSVTLESDGEKIKKTMVKNARLSLYPTGMNIVHASRGLKRPVQCTARQDIVEQWVADYRKTFSTAYKIMDDETGFTNTLVYASYQRKKPE